MLTLTREMVHELNNALGAMIGYTEMVMERLPSGSREHADLNHAIEAGQRVKSLLHRSLDPDATGDCENRAKPLERSSPRRGAGEIVLLVNRDPALLEGGEEVLAALGYEPIGYTSGQEALDELRGEPPHFDLAILDLEAAEFVDAALPTLLRRIRPDFPILLSADAIDTGAADRASRIGKYEIIRKPLRTTELADAIWRVLGKLP